MLSLKTYLQSSSISNQLTLSHEPAHGLFYKKISRYLVAGVITIAAMVPIASQAQSLMQNKAETQSMETITVIHRSAFDYALYEQTTEMLTHFNRELAQKIIVQARFNNLTMAKEFGFFANQSNELALIDKYPENIGVLEISE
ncbi:hypothetical protein [Shewanella donghaensis]|uniref:hypothetical protein n=1 Tax=Shewanella donghaensis TaxID=238836 RepID=UPI0011846325|nr:hypothetical protein [Shewanella donghaensis]